MRITLFRHTGLKVLAFGLATLLWMVVGRDDTVERGLRVPLELLQLPSGLELRGEPPTLIDVRVRASSGALSRVDSGDIVAVLDLEGARPGRRLFQLTPEQVRAPFGIEVVQVTPGNVAMVLERAATRWLPVGAWVEGDPAPGYTRGAITVDPPTVEVVGPESVVNEATEAVTETVSIAGATAAVTERVSVGFLDPSMRLMSPRLVTVEVEVLPRPGDRVLRARPVQLRNIGANLTAQASPPLVDVVLRIGVELLRRLDAEQVTPFVDLAGLAAGEHTLVVGVEELAGAGLVRVEPSLVQVRITRVER